jgi:hypothetical protein
MVADIEATFDGIEDFAREHGVELRDEELPYPRLLRLRVGAETVRRRGGRPEALLTGLAVLAWLIVLSAPALTVSLLLPQWVWPLDLVVFPVAFYYTCTLPERIGGVRRRRREAARVGPGWAELQITLRMLADAHEAQAQR